MISQNGEGQGLQGVTGQNGGAFIKRLVHRWLTATQIVVIHGGQIVVQQGVGVDALHRGSGAVQQLALYTQHLAEA